MKIQIQQFTKKGVISSIINRSSLKNYIFYSKIGNKNVWIKKELYNKVISKLQKKAKPASYKLVTGRSKDYDKKYMYFKFSLWRYKLIEDKNVKVLFEKIRKKYESIKKQGKKFPAQRIGLTFSSEKREFDTFINSRTRRVKTIELLDSVSTSYYANNDESTEGMFEELYNKVIAYFRNVSKSPSMLDDDYVKEVKNFFVFFIEE